MAIKFNRLIRPDLPDTTNWLPVGIDMLYKSATEPMIFMSHKTGDRQAEQEANYISNQHGVQVYMVEWDDNIQGDSNELPYYIMFAIRKSDGFLVNVIPNLAVSMWVGYEIGVAHAMEKPSAKIMYSQMLGLPSVVGALSTLHSRSGLDRWIRSICDKQSGRRLAN